MADDTHRPNYLIAVASPRQADPAEFRQFVTWAEALQGVYRVAVLIDLRHPPGVRATRAVCLRLGIRLIVSPPPPRAGVALAAETWDVVELAAGIELPVAAGLLAALGKRARVVVENDERAAERVRHGTVVAIGSAAADTAISTPAEKARRIADALLRTPAARPAAALAGSVRPAPGLTRKIVRDGPVPRQAVAGSSVNLLQVSPSQFGTGGILGGGERYVENLCKAVRIAARSRGVSIDISFLACGTDPAEYTDADGLHRIVLRGDPGQLSSLDHPTLLRAVQTAEVVHVHQCLSPFGLTVAASARLLGKRVIGTDHGGADLPFLYDFPSAFGVYDAIQTYSNFGSTAFVDFDITPTCIPGPVDDALFTPDTVRRDHSMLLAVGRILPHKGLETVIDALPDSLHLVVAGRAYDADYFDLLKRRAAGRRVRFETGLEDAGLLALMRQAGLCVHPGTWRDYRGQEYLKPELLGLAPLECMCTGLPALVGTAGALAELAAVPGCTVAEPGDFGRHLRAQAESPAPCGEEVRAAVVSRFGLLQFGERYLDFVARCASC